MIYLIGLIPLFYYYKLAKEYNKNIWGYAILGFIAYVAGVMFIGRVLDIFVGLFPFLLHNNKFYTTAITVFLIYLLSGLLFARVLYVILKNNFEKNNTKVIDKLEDIEKNGNDTI